jgi:glycosyltransferase involved in cell wall biosynthesis
MVEPGLAIIANCVTPYRVNLHRLIAAGIPELKLHTLITHDDADFQWSLQVPKAINIRYFGFAGDSPLTGTFHAPFHEWRKGGRLIRFLQDNNVRAVICNNYRYLSFLRVIRHCHKRGVPIFVNNDSNIRSERRLSPFEAWIKRRIYSWWMKRVSGVMSMGELGDQFFIKYGANPQRLYRLPYTPDYDAFARPDQDRLQRFRKKYGLCDERKLMLYSGRLSPVKRVDLLIDAFAQLADERPEWGLLIAGDGPLDAELRSRVPERLRLRVIWTGFLEQEDLKSAYHASEVLVLPSDREPWAVVVQEAMAAGLAIVASDSVGAAHELVVDRWNGRIFATGDLAALTQAIADVTRRDATNSIKEKSRAALEEWRRSNEPIEEIRRALTDVGVLPAKVS